MRDSMIWRNSSRNAERAKAATAMIVNINSVEMLPEPKTRS